MTQNSNQDIPGNLEPQYKGIYGGYEKNEYGKGEQQQYGGVSHKRQTSTLHGHFNHSKGHSLSEGPGQGKEVVYGTAPDLPPRVDRAVKPMGLLTTPTKTPNG